MTDTIVNQCAIDTYIFVCRGASISFYHKIALCKPFIIANSMYINGNFPEKHLFKSAVKPVDLWSLIRTAASLLRPLFEVNLLYNSIDFMFILPLFCKATCLLRPISVENFNGHSKEVLLY